MKRFICLFNGHKVTGWSKQKGYAPGRPLPMAYCERCGMEL